MSWRVHFRSDDSDAPRRQIEVKSSTEVNMAMITVGNFQHSATATLDMEEVRELHKALGEVIKMRKKRPTRGD